MWRKKRNNAHSTVDFFHAKTAHAQYDALLCNPIISNMKNEKIMTYTKPDLSLKPRSDTSSPDQTPQPSLLAKLSDLI